MKNHKIIGCSILTLMLLMSVSCTNLLTETPRSQVTPTSFASETGLLGGITAVYHDMRAFWGTEGFTCQQLGGTDEQISAGSVGGTNLPFFNYSGVQGSQFSGFNLYTDINTLNGILFYGPTSGIPTAKLNAYLGQAQFMRAYLYFFLVQTYGNIPLHQTFITSPTQSEAPANPLDIYTLIISDLNSAITNLPNIPTAPFLGKAATAGTAKWLLAKAYLTKGWLTNDPNDFTLAYNTATDLIAKRTTYGLDLWADYADAFNPANDYGKETLFVVDRNTDPSYGNYDIVNNTAGGLNNVQPWLGLCNLITGGYGLSSTLDANGIIKGGGSNVLARDIQFGRPFTRYRPNMVKMTTGPNTGKTYILDQAFQDRINDSRYWKTFQSVWLENADDTNKGATLTGLGKYSGAGVAGPRGTLTCGLDTAYWFPDSEVTTNPQQYKGKPFKGIIITPNMQSNNTYPYMKKLADPNRAQTNYSSTRPTVIARFSDVYLIAAEAAFKLGDNVNAAVNLNVVRQRAAYRTNKPYTQGGAFGSSTPATIIGDPYPPGGYAAAIAAVTITSSQVTLDFILDERTREFFGEGTRWLDLVRTQSLLNRVNAWNPEAAANIKPGHVLRPIPQNEIDLVTVGPKYPQNPGY